MYRCICFILFFICMCIGLSKCNAFCKCMLCFGVHCLVNMFNPPMTGGGGDGTPNRFFLFFLGNGKSFYFKQNF